MVLPATVLTPVNLATPAGRGERGTGIFGDELSVQKDELVVAVVDSLPVDGAGMETVGGIVASATCAGAHAMVEERSRRVGGFTHDGHSRSVR